MNEKNKRKTELVATNMGYCMPHNLRKYKLFLWKWKKFFFLPSFAVRFLCKIRNIETIAKINKKKYLPRSFVWFYIKLVHFMQNKRQHRETKKKKNLREEKREIYRDESSHVGVEKLNLEICFHVFFFFVNS